MYAAVEAHEDMDEDAPTEVKAGWYQLVVWALFAVGTVPSAVCGSLALAGTPGMGVTWFLTWILSANVNFILPIILFISFISFDISFIVLAKISS